MTFFHQRMLRNKKSKNWMLEWLWIIKCLERKKMFDMRNNFMLELMQLHVWKRHIHFQYRYPLLFVHKCIFYVQNMQKRIMYVHFIDQMLLFNILHMIFLLPLRKLHKCRKIQFIACIENVVLNRNKEVYTSIWYSSQ